MKINLNKTIMTIGVCALAAAVFADDQIPGNMSSTDTNNWDNQPVTSQSFVWAAATTDMKEIHMGELALQKSDNADVKSFAKRIVADHKKACKKLRAIADKEGLNFPDTNSMAWDANGRWQTNSTSESQHPAVEHQDMDSPPHLAYLMVSNANGTVNGQWPQHEINWDALSGAEFDRAFANHMVMGHEKAIRKFENASANLQDADLKKYADKTLPTLRDHLRRAQELQSQVGEWTDSDMTNSAYYQNK